MNFESSTIRPRAIVVPPGMHSLFHGINDRFLFHLQNENVSPQEAVCIVKYLQALLFKYFLFPDNLPCQRSRFHSILLNHYADRGTVLEPQHIEHKNFQLVQNSRRQQIAVDLN